MKVSSVTFRFLPFVYYDYYTFDILQKFDYTNLMRKNVKIKICLCRGNDVTGTCGEWKIQTFDKPDLERKIGNQIIEENKFSQGFSVLAKCLETYRDKIEQHIELKDRVELYNIKIYDRYEKLDMVHIKNVTEWLKKSNFDVVHVLARSMLKKSKAPVVEAIQSLQDKCVLVSPCVATKRPPAPVNFPCQMSIAVGLEFPKDEDEEEIQAERQDIGLISMKKKRLDSQTKNYRVDWQSCGSALDFVCARHSEGVEIRNPWEASYYTTAIVALILVKAYTLGELE